jgi:hypothetical protein
MNEYARKVYNFFEPLSDDFSAYEAKRIDVLRKNLKKYFTDTDYVIEELGLASFHFKYQFMKDKLERLCNEIVCTQSNNNEFLTVLKEILKDLDDLHANFLNETKLMNENKIDENSLSKIISVKVKTLLKLLKNKYDSEKKIHSIVFVERREAAYLLNQLLNNLSKEEATFIKSGYIIGSNDDLIKMASKDQVIS